MFGPLLTTWTIRLALLAYALWLAVWLSWPGGAGGLGPRVSRWLYTLACALFLAHVVCAFHFYHGWSHQHAFDDTARQTRDMLGVAFGVGIYFSYVFTLLWTADVAWLWLWPQRRPVWLVTATQLYLAFIALNGAVVFEGGVTRFFGVPIAVALGALAIWRLCQTRAADPGEASSSKHQISNKPQVSKAQCSKPSTDNAGL